MLKRVDGMAAIESVTASLEATLGLA